MRYSNYSYCKGSLLSNRSNRSKKIDKNFTVKIVSIECERLSVIFVWRTNYSLSTHHWLRSRVYCNNKYRLYLTAALEDRMHNDNFLKFSIWTLSITRRRVSNRKFQPSPNTFFVVVLSPKMRHFYGNLKKNPDCQIDYIYIQLLFETLRYRRV